MLLFYPLIQIMLGLTEHSTAQDTIYFINIEIASVPSTK